MKMDIYTISETDKQDLCSLYDITNTPELIAYIILTIIAFI